MDQYLSHSANDDGNGIPELLKEHLSKTSIRAGQYAEPFGARKQAELAGLLHDLGKYADQFQRRLADPRNNPGRDHWTAGATCAIGGYHGSGEAVAYAIQGHHAGLTEIQCGEDFRQNINSQLQNRPNDFTETNINLLIKRFLGDGFELPDRSSFNEGLGKFTDHSAANMLDVRMLFSTLVDADFVETEAHFEGNAVEPRKYRPEGRKLDAAHAFRIVKTRIDELAGNTNAGDAMRQVRADLSTACLAAAERDPGIFTLSAPTGAGKTLAMLAFALRHAMKHNLQRVIVVMPFLSIIDQTVKIYRSLFTEANGFQPADIIEDHSNVQKPKKNEDQPNVADEDDGENYFAIQRLLAQNWDAPFILTTSVQCLESLMSNRPGACRKLHRLANSVILFDEVQTLPPQLAVATLATLSRLCERFGSTVVFSTATQPAFDHLHDMVSKQASRGWQPVEIVEKPEKLFAPVASRVRVNWQHEQTKPWEELAGKLRDYEQVLCIVNLKDHARQLVNALRENSSDSSLLHLSTDMCGAHREKTLDAVKACLKENRPIRLVSTQCIEAGVDIDFPVVYRAMAPLEAIAQAAGRCNRHGSRSEGGRVVVFKPETNGKPLTPPGAYKQACESAEIFLSGIAEGNTSLDNCEILHDPDQLRRYFKQFYTLSQLVEGSYELNRGLDACDFATVAKEYRLITQDSINVLVPYDCDAFDELLTRLEEAERLAPEFLREWMRDARPHVVSIHRPKLTDAKWNHLEPIRFSRWREIPDSEVTWFKALEGATYDDVLGLEFSDGVMCI